MLIGVGFAIPAALQILHGAPAPTSLIGLAHQYGFPVLLLLAGYQLYDRDSFDDVVDKVKSILPGKS